MADRSITVHLRANITDYQREMSKAVTPLDELVKKSGDASGQASTMMGKLAQSARHQAAEWRTVGSSLLVAGGAMTAMMTAVAKTGIEYNTLQQSSRAALTTIMGGGAAANAQMDKLDDFARNSPFAKQVFIQAQQQMLGFGIETQKVIPYLDAIQNAVAATGGSNQDIAELSRIFSQVSASAKITATDLQMFGQRGIDAATIIGSQMGMTGQEIRESITAGTLDAGQALDALATGMQARFGGAAEGVKDTMVGAVDRIKAAWRDLSSTIMAGAVNPEGGGWLVDLTNQAADFMRAIEGLPDPVLRAAGAMTGLSGVALLVVGGIMTMIPKVFELAAAWQALGQTYAVVDRMGRLMTRFTPIAIVIGGLAAAAISLNEALKPVPPTLEQVARALERAGDNAGALDRIFQDVDGGPLFKAAQDGQRSIQGMSDALEVLSNVNVWDRSPFHSALYEDADRAIEQFNAMDEALQSMGAAAQQDFMSGLISQLQETGWTSEQIADRLGVMMPESVRRAQDALDDLAATTMGPVHTGAEALVNILAGDLPGGLSQSEDGTYQLASAMDDAADSADDMADGASDAADAMLEIIGAARDAENAIRGLNNAHRDGANALMDAQAAGDRYIATLQAATQQIKDNGKSLDENSEKGRANRAYIRDLATQARDYTDAMLENGASIGEVNAKAVEQRGQLVEVLRQFGMTKAEAEAYTDSLGLIPNYVETTVATPGAKLSKREADDLNAALRGLPDDVKSEIITVANRRGYDEAMRLLNRANGYVATSYINIITTQIQRQIRQGVDPVRHNLRQADGGVVDYYAGGGLRESHVAQIAPAGSWRVWAEPETGGEAYIPLAAAKRARSLDIWAETGRRLGVPGYADGDISAQRYQYQPSIPAISSVYGGGGGNSGTTINIGTVVNPIAEPATTTASRELQRIGAGVDGMV